MHCTHYQILHQKTWNRIAPRIFNYNVWCTDDQIMTLNLGWARAAARWTETSVDITLLLLELVLVSPETRDWSQQPPETHFMSLCPPSQWEIGQFLPNMTFMPSLSCSCSWVLTILPTHPQLDQLENICGTRARTGIMLPQHQRVARKWINVVFPTQFVIIYQEDSQK